MNSDPGRIQSIPLLGTAIHPVFWRGFAPSWGQTFCFPELSLREPFQEWRSPTLNNEQETPLSVSVCWCPGISLTIIKKNQRRWKKPLISAAFTTPLSHLHCSQLLHRTLTLEKLQSLSCSLLVLPHLEWAPVFPIKWDLRFPWNLSSRINSYRKSSLINPTPCDLFFPFMFSGPTLHGTLSCQRDWGKCSALPSLVIRSWQHLQISKRCSITLFLVLHMSVI